MCSEAFERFVNREQLVVIRDRRRQLKLDQATFAKVAEATRLGCPVSRALGLVKITLDATLKA